MNDASPATTRRRLLSIGAVAVAGGTAGCLGDDGDDGGQGTDGSGVDGVTAEADVVVTVGESGEHQFQPDQVYVEPGQSVRWEWEGGFHTVTPGSIPEESDWEGHPQEADERSTHEHTFEVTGEYQYYCEPHRDQGMTGVVVVSENLDGGGNGSDGGNDSDGANETEYDPDRTDPGTGGGGGDAEGGGDEVDGEEVADEEEPGSGG